MRMAKSPHSPIFRKALESISQGGILAPSIRSYLTEPKFDGFDIKIRGMNKRKHDNYFHPSTHPIWSERALYLYLTVPEALGNGIDNPMSIFSMTAGTIWHEIIGHILKDELGLLSELEIPVQCSETLSRGSMDGIVAGRDEIFEFKTARDTVVNRIKSVDDYINNHWNYYLQAQEYMRMSGYKKERVLVMGSTFPFDMREFVIDFDPKTSASVKEKYLRVREAVASGKNAPQCDGCSYVTYGCPAKLLCEN